MDGATETSAAAEISPLVLHLITFALPYIGSGASGLGGRVLVPDLREPCLKASRKRVTR